MNQIRRWQRILFLSLLSISVLAPLVFVSNRLKTITPVGQLLLLLELRSGFDLRLIESHGKSLSDLISGQVGENLSKNYPTL